MQEGMHLNDFNDIINQLIKNNNKIQFGLKSILCINYYSLKGTNFIFMKRNFTNNKR